MLHVVKCGLSFVAFSLDFACCAVVGFVESMRPAILPMFQLVVGWSRGWCCHGCCGCRVSCIGDCWIVEAIFVGLIKMLLEFDPGLVSKGHVAPGLEVVEEHSGGFDIANGRHYGCFVGDFVMGCCIGACLGDLSPKCFDGLGGVPFCMHVLEIEGEVFESNGAVVGVEVVQNCLWCDLCEAEELVL